MKDWIIFKVLESYDSADWKHNESTLLLMVSPVMFLYNTPTYEFSSSSTNKLRQIQKCGMEIGANVP